jgi:Peptidase family C25
MKKILFTAVILLLVTTGFSQLNNSWIDYNKTYFKFKIGKDTLCRIPQSVLATAGLGSVPAQNFQLWRNGKEVRIYTSVASGTLGATDYLEFWGEMNDGKPDKTLYRDTDFQLDDKYSLYTDTAMYYLTVNPSGGNLRYIQSANPVAGNTLPADTYFMRRVEEHYKNNINRGYYRDLGTSVYSSAYDKGEGWSSGGINTCCALFKSFTGVNKYAAGPANSVMFTVSAYGNAWWTRDLVARINSTSVLPTPNPMPFMDSYHKDTVRNLPLSLIANPSGFNVSVKGENSSNPTSDYIVVSSLSVTYPATFNFNNEKNFYFELVPSATGNYLVINNFNKKGAEPILYDITNGRRYLGDSSTPGQIKFVLPPSSNPIRKFNLIAQDVSNISNITTLTSKTFLNFSNTVNQGDYIIISNPALYDNGSGINYVDQYKQYRSSVAGGGYNAKVYDIDELTDQFAFGINKHPVAIRDFISYANQQFSVKPKFTFLIGRGVAYNQARLNQTDAVSDSLNIRNKFEIDNANLNKLNLVPTFGWPASDVLLVSNPGTVVPTVAIGRIGAINGNEVGNYLEKMKQYEAVQKSSSQTIADKAWMKNIIHLSGGADSLETVSFVNDLNQYKVIAEDTLFGAHVETFAKSSSSSVQEASSARVDQLIKDGVSLISYFGHSSANTLAFNLSNPELYQNQGKYPFINVSGCSAGDFFNYDATRLTGNISLSEKYIFAKQKGSIGFLADTHYGIEPFLDTYNVNLYKEICINNYGGSIGNQIKQTIQNKINNVPQPIEYYLRMHLEELTLQGDPALMINTHAKPDYIMEEQLIKVSPSVISVADNNFNLNVKMLNIGRAINDSIRVTVKRKLPTDSIKVLFDSVIAAIRYSDSLSFIVPVNPITDKGLNKIIVTLDVNNKVAELSEMNNTTEKEFYIYEDEVRPVYPYNFSIINQQNITFIANTANPLAQQRQYVMEIDTTELFNSSFKKTYNSSGNGGAVEFKPGNITFVDSTVYYWRTSMVPVGTSNVIWNNYSFIYLPNGGSGFNQSHYYQHLKSNYKNINYNTVSRNWDFEPYLVAVNMKNGVFPVSANLAQDFEINVNGANVAQSVCATSNVMIISAFNPYGFVPMLNVASGPGSFGSDPVCGPTKKYSFAYTLTNSSQRAAAMNFLKNVVPNGYYVVVMNFSNANAAANTYANDWKLDDPTGTNTLYHTLKNAGFVDIDSFYKPRAFNFIYKKNDNTFIPSYKLSQGISDKLEFDVLCHTKQGNGTVTSPLYGPAKSWSQFHWRGASQEPSAGDSIAFNVIGVSPAGTETTLYTIDSLQKDVDISTVDAKLYPYIKLKMYNSDKVTGTPYQLGYWRLNYTPVPEGTIAPNILFQMKDTVEQGEVIDFKVAFKNISPSSFDSAMKFKFIVYNKDNFPTQINVPKGKILIAGDTLLVQYKIDTKNYSGNNTLFVDVNPNNDQPEQSHFNNVLFKDFYVRPDNYNPSLDVTFDGVHILNKDIIAAKPHIYIKLKDESKFLALNDTSLFKVQVLYPDNTLHNYSFGDSMRFNPANIAAGENAATIDFIPYFNVDSDGGYYELIITGKDVAGNKAGAVEYRVQFSVINKPMISNLLNYPNPFTTSTAFVFTLTGSELPQNMRIQILTITGKVVREITKDELGPIHIGRNITEFKWDGTDMYGQKLANGVYLYRVLTNLNGQSLEKYKATSDKTDKYFNKGYGKMVLIR